MKTLQSLQWQQLGFHFLIFSVNSAGDSIAFISEGINFLILGPDYDAELYPLQTLWIGCAINWDVCLKW